MGAVSQNNVGMLFLFYQHQRISCRSAANVKQKQHIHPVNSREMGEIKQSSKNNLRSQSSSSFWYIWGFRYMSHMVCVRPLKVLWHLPRGFGSEKHLVPKLARLLQGSLRHSLDPTTIPKGLRPLQVDCCTNTHTQNHMPISFGSVCVCVRHRVILEWI